MSGHLQFAPSHFALTQYIQYCIVTVFVLYTQLTKLTKVKICCLAEEYEDRYRDVARRGSLLYSVMSDLHKINSLYVYSLNVFVAVFQVQCGNSTVLTQVIIVIIELRYTLLLLSPNKGIFSPAPSLY